LLAVVVVHAKPDDVVAVTADDAGPVPSALTALTVYE